MNYEETCSGVFPMWHRSEGIVNVCNWVAVSADRNSTVPGEDKLYIK